MVRNYKPKTNADNLDVALFEAYFGLEVTGQDEPGSGALSRLDLSVRSPVSRSLKGAVAPWFPR
jgi:hypothetical protein